ncbi:MAG TPA: zf-HC2 domain-containing protein [Thermoflexus sp.]|nr:zf-HC2 domain-containing protein [Thermoflexus sp.]
MTCEWFRERMAEALEGILSDAEAREWEAHRRTCHACRALWEVMMEVDARLRTAPMAAPPPDLSQRIRRRIRRQIWWERWGAMLLFMTIGLGIAMFWKGTLQDMRGWLADLWDLIPNLGSLFWELIRIPITFWALMMLLGMAAVLAMGIWASMRAIYRTRCF